MTFCVLGENCSVYDRHSKVAGVSLRNPLCEGCRNRADRDLNLLRYDYVDLSQLIAKKDGHSEAKIARPKPESSPPLDVGVLTLRSDIAASCFEAEIRLRAYSGDRPRPPENVREGWGLDASIRYLRPRLEELALMPAIADLISGVEYLLEFSTLHRRARKVCGLDPRTIGLPGDCPQCHTPTLRRHDDDAERVWCGRCNLHLSKDDYYAAQRMQFAPVTPAQDSR